MQRQGLLRREVLAGAAAFAAVSRSPAWAAQEQELAFLVIGDWGRKGKAQQKAVAQQMAARAQAIDSRFVVTVGDNFYYKGVKSTTDPHWRQSFTDIYNPEHLHTWYPALGNHDRDGDYKAQLAYGPLSAGRWNMDAPAFARPYYKVGYDLANGGRIELFILDTSPIADSKNYPADPQYLIDQKQWLERELAASKATWKLVFGHHFLYSSGYRKTRDYPEMRSWLETLLQDCGVQAYIAGHDHHLEYLQVKNLNHIISGGGHEGDRLRTTPVPGHQFGWATAGFTSYRIAGDVLSVEFIDVDGLVRRTVRIPVSGGTDAVTISADAARLPAPIAA